MGCEEVDSKRTTCKELEDFASTCYSKISLLRSGYALLVILFISLLCALLSQLLFFLFFLSCPPCLFFSVSFHCLLLFCVVLVDEAKDKPHNHKLHAPDGED